eukprot:gene14616-biopygen5130
MTDDHVLCAQRSSLRRAESAKSPFPRSVKALECPGAAPAVFGRLLATTAASPSNNSAREHTFPAHTRARIPARARAVAAVAAAAAGGAVAEPLPSRPAQWCPSVRGA